MRAPKNISDDFIDAFIAKHRCWIEKRRAEIAKTPEISFKDGAEITLFGSNYIIATGPKRIGQREIDLPQENRETALISLLKKFSGETMRNLTEQIALRNGFSYQKVRSSSARGRWGSCNRDGVIAYTFRVAFLSPEECEYIAVHELAHTKYMNHSPQFWKEVERVLPDWETRRKLLRSHGAIMNLL